MTWWSTASAVAVPLLTVLALLIGWATWYVKDSVKLGTLEAGEAERKKILDMVNANIQMIVRSEILEANGTQLRQINGTYVRAAGSTVTGAELTRSLDEVKSEIAVLRDGVAGAIAFDQVSRQRMDGMHEDILRLQHASA